MVHPVTVVATAPSLTSICRNPHLPHLPGDARRSRSPRSWPLLIRRRRECRPSRRRASCKSTRGDERRSGRHRTVAVKAPIDRDAMCGKRLDGRREHRESGTRLHFAISASDCSPTSTPAPKLPKNSQPSSLNLAPSITSAPLSQAPWNLSPVSRARRKDRRATAGWVRRRQKGRVAEGKGKGSAASRRNAAG